MKTLTASSYFGMYIDGRVLIRNNRISSYYGVDDVTIYVVDEISGETVYEQITDCQLILKPLSEMTEEDKSELQTISGFEIEDLDILEGGTAHLVTLDNITQFYTFCIKHGYDIFNLLTKKIDGKIIAVKGKQNDLQT